MAKRKGEVTTTAVLHFRDEAGVEWVAGASITKLQRRDGQGQPEALAEGDSRKLIGIVLVTDR